MEYRDALTQIEVLPRFGQSSGLTRMRRLMARLGDPQRGMRIVHIAGSNGKGSTAVYCESILRQAGYHTGLFVSPYIYDFRERIQLDGCMVDRQQMADTYAQLQPVVAQMAAEGDPCVQFEVITALALLIFRRAGCDVVVLEVGIGGLLDSTNIIDPPLAAAITSLSLEHTALLGRTLTEIARQKCGIIKPGCAVVSAPDQLAEVFEVIRQTAQEKNVPLRVPEDEDIHLLWSTLRENHIDYGGYEVSLKMPGAHQAANAAVAVEAALALCDQGYAIPDEAILAGLGEAKLPARIEMLRYQPLRLVDGAHNPAGGAALAAALKSAKVTPLTAILGMMGDKDVSAYLAELKDCFDRVYTVCADDGARGMSADALAEKASCYFRHVEAKRSFAEAVEAAEKDGRGVCVCGSLYLAGTAENFFD